MLKPARFHWIVALVLVVIASQPAESADLIRSLSALERTAAASAKSLAGSRLNTALKLVSDLRKAPFHQASEARAKTGLSTRQQKLLRVYAGRMGKSLKQDGARMREWQAIFKAGRKGARVDVQAMILFVMRQSYRQTVDDLAALANKVKAYNDKKKQLRQQVAKYRQRASRARQKTTSGRASSKAEAQRQLDRLEDQLAKIGDDAQLANLKLQQQMQKAQKFLQTMSAILKALNDQANSIIRNLK